MGRTKQVDSESRQPFPREAEHWGKDTRQWFEGIRAERESTPSSTEAVSYFAQMEPERFSWGT